MRLLTALILTISLITLNVVAALASPSDAGHVYFVEPVTPTEPEPIDEPETPADNIPTAITLKPNMNALRQVVLTEEMIRKIASLFPNDSQKNVYSLMGSENISLNTDARAVDSGLTSHLEETGEEVILALPSATATSPGIYILGIVMDGISDSGTLIDSVSTLTPSSTASEFRQAADIDQIILMDQGGNLIPPKRATNGRTYATVPDNKNMLAAVSLNSGETWTASITKPLQLPTILVEPVTLEQIAAIVQETDEQAQTETIEQTTERITSNIIEAVQEIISRPEVIDFIINDDTIANDILSRDIVSTDIKTFTSADIVSSPEEPTQAMQEAVKEEGYEIAAKLNTIQVSESGFYLFKVTLSEESFQKLQGLTADEVRVYALNDSEAEIVPAFIIGMLNTFEMLTMSGEKMNTIGVREFLLIGILNAGKPLSLYLAKLILMMLLGGCYSGWGVAVVSAVPVVIALTKFYRR